MRWPRLHQARPPGWSRRRLYEPARKMEMQPGPRTWSPVPSRLENAQAGQVVVATVQLDEIKGAKDSGKDVAKGVDGLLRKENKPTHTTQVFRSTVDLEDGVRASPA
eukprot:3592271-Pleurochrysis_carterae.AAC.1